MKKKFFWFDAVIIISLLIIGEISLFLLFSPKNISATEIFDANRASVVELKALSSGVGESFGTAVFVSDKGTLITNAHNVTYSNGGETFTFESVFIRFMDNEAYLKVELEKYDVELDLAVLSYTGNHVFTPCNLGDSTKIKSGDHVFAMGNALNHGLTISQGIVGIPSMNVKYNEIVKEYCIQCDLTITEGNSGGALFDAKGKLVGVTSFRIKNPMGTIESGFAYCIPSNAVANYLKN